MKQPPNKQSTQIRLRPPEVWMSLTQPQQNAILQTLVRICQHLARQELREGGNELELSD